MQSQKEMKWLLLFIFLLSLPALACGVFGEEEEATSVPQPSATEDVDEPAEAATDTPEPDPTDTAEPDPTDTPDVEPRAPDLGDLSDLGDTLDSFASYRLSVEMRFTGQGEDAQEGGVVIDSAVITEPPASSTSISMEGALVEEAGGMNSLAVAELDNTAYMVLPGMGCVSGGADEMGSTTDEFADVFDTEDLLGEIDGADFVGEDTVNGVDVYHYRFDETNIDDSSNDLREVEGNVYVAQEGNYVVRMVIDGVGQMDLFGEGTEEEGAIHIEYNVTDVDADFEIEIPEGCEDSGAAYPVMDDATNEASFAGFTSYETATAVDEVVTFYEEEMAALGYETGEDSSIFEDTAILTFVQEGMPDVSVAISRDGGTTSVLITSEPADE